MADSDNGYDDLFGDEETPAAAPQAAAPAPEPATTPDVTAEYHEDAPEPEAEITASYVEDADVPKPPAARKRAVKTAPPKRVVRAEPGPEIEDEEPQPAAPEVYRIRVVNDLSIGGQTYLPGQILHIPVGSRLHEETVGADGRSWLDLASDPEAQRRRWHRSTPLIEAIRG